MSGIFASAAGVGGAPRIRRGRFVLIPASAETHGHGTHTWAALWKDELAKLLKRSEGR